MAMAVVVVVAVAMDEEEKVVIFLRETKNYDSCAEKTSTFSLRSESSHCCCRLR